MKIFNKIGLVMATLIASLSISATNNVFAEEIGLGISPGIRRTELDPGAIYRNSMSVENLSDRTVTVAMHAEPYYVEDFTYDALYDVHNAYTQISKWVSFEQEEYTIEPHNVVVVNFSVAVPDDAPGGGQYAALFAETQEKDETGTVRPTASAGMILMAKINGETRRQGEIIDVSVPGFLLNPPLEISTTAKNEGNVDETLTMSIKVEDYFSGNVIHDDTETPQDATVFPGTSRKVDLILSSIPRLGVLKVTVTNSYINDAEIKSRLVFICPIWFIAIVILIILTVVFRILAKKRDDRRTRANSRNSTGSADKFNI